MTRPLTIGLTGGIASGKSAVADEFIRLGVEVVDADRIAREVVAPGQPALEEIRRAFGDDIVQTDGSLDRRRLRKTVFADAEARKRLEAIVHPRVRERLLRAREEATSEYVILMVPLLVESGMSELVDRVLVVDVPPEIQAERLTARDAIDAALAQRMIGTQAPREQRLEHADDVLVNTVPRDRLPTLVAQLHEAYLRQARQSRKRHLPASEQ